jgi:flagellar hook-associated protein 2
MGVIRAGGLASGLDTNSIIEELVKNAKEPITRLESQLHLKELEKAVYNKVNEQLNDLRTALFNLRLESVFKAKNVLSSSSYVASATVTNDAKVGSHVVEVLQTAQKASMTSRYTSTRLNIAGGGVTGLDTTYRLPHILDQLEGVHTTNITTQASSNVTIFDSGLGNVKVSTAVTLFEPHESTSYKKYSGTDPVTGVVSYNGEIVSTTSAGETLQLTVNINGNDVLLNPLTVVVSDSAHSITVTDNVTGIILKADNSIAGREGYNDINTLMSLMEQAVNNQLNAKMGTDDVQYMTFRADFEYPDPADPTNWNWRVAAYDISTENISLVSASGNGATLFGVNTGFTTSTATTIAKYHIAKNDAELQARLSGYTSGVIYGVKTAFSTLQNGLFQIVQDASMNVRTPTKTSLLGDTAGTGINVTESLSGNATGLSYSDLSAIAGTFTINGTKITIDSAARSINEIMAIVNSSGAGVIMQFDSATDRFLLTSNEYGPTTIATGVSGDTSKFFEIFKVSVGYGATSYPGNTAGNIDANTALAEAPFTNPISSGVFTINGVPIYVNSATDSINDVIRKVNTSGAGVTLSYDSTRDKFYITSKDANRIIFGNSIPEDTSNILEVFGLTYDTRHAVVQGTAGTDAIVKIDGQVYRRTDNEINDAIEGVTLKITSVGTTVIDISSDTSKVVEALASFIKIYNSMIDALKLEAISTSDREDKMPTLTEDKKANMSEDDIATYMKEYDELHSKDIILKSREIKDLLKNLRMNALGIFISTESKFKSLREVGVNVVGEGDYTLTQYGFLITESTDLADITAAIEKNSALMENIRNYADDLYLFFAQTKEESYVDAGGATRTRTIYNGWARNYETLVRNYQDVEGAIGVKVRSDGAIDKAMQQLKKSIEVKQRSAEAYLEVLWKQFTAMETRVAAINSQSSYIEQLAANALKNSSKS